MRLPDYSKTTPLYNSQLHSEPFKFNPSSISPQRPQPNHHHQPTPLIAMSPPIPSQQPPTNSATRKLVSQSGWTSLPTMITQQDRALAQQQDQHKARRQELREMGLADESSRTLLKGTYRRVTIREDGTRSGVLGNVSTVHGPSNERQIG